MGNEIRLGKVSAVDHPAGMVRVVYHEKDDDVTRMIPILSTVFSGAYSMLKKTAGYPLERLPVPGQTCPIEENCFSAT